MKTTFKYDHYYLYEELSANLKYFADQYPSYTKLESICTNDEHREVWAFTLTKDIEIAASKPAFYVDGNHHAGEVTGSMACMHTLDYLLSNLEDEKVAHLLQQFTFYFIPRISPSGAEAYLTTDAKLRSVNRMYPYNTIKEGHYPCDIDNDGSIRKMRIKTPMGAWKISHLDPRLMERRKPSDLGEDFYHVFDEGRVYGYDGLMIKEGPCKWGLDFNRNYPFGWFTEYRQPGAGKYPLSNPENKAVADFVINHPNIGSALTMHTTGGMIIYPPGTKPAKQAHPKDMMMYRQIGEIATAEMGYPCMNIFDTFLWDQVNYSSGAFDDWMYHTQGIPTYTVELWNLHQRAGVEEVWPIKVDKTDEVIHQDEYKVLKWIDENLESGAYKPWTKVEHPDLKEVEIGGIDVKFIHQNCPNQFLLQEVEKTTRFTLLHALVLPKAVIETTDVLKLAENLYKVSITLANHSYLPTYCCEEARLIEVAKPIEITVLSDVEFISGQKTTQIKGLNGFGYMNTNYGYESIESSFTESQMACVSYIIKTEQDSFDLLVNSEKAGQFNFKIKLK